ncbi:hypothetical protein CK203_023562 [Vitis vinifera]|uniref:Endonuclease/exonuclease/phosphatase domain-containing protein n=1 Tax=Vitis vinifera TaxID=29760 RepID=A0A438JBT4_VITVI|nr:hypothetical protein CK203_023562 [Vitis vinifera]
MNLKLLSWNVRGANDSFKRKVIKSVVRKQKVDLLCIQETKIQDLSNRVVRSLGSGRFLGWKALDAFGSVGGLLIFWDKRSQEMLEWEEGQFSISRFRNVENWVVWVFTGVYGPFTKEERECLWEETGAIRGIWEEPWCCRRARSRGFTDARGSFTWSGGLNNQSRASWWQEMVVRGSASFRLTAKLKELKQNLKNWNREVFGSLECNKDATLQQVEYWDRMECERSLTDEELTCKKEAKEGYAKWVDLEETHWRQASRELWLKEGGRNTGYFHRMASAHRRANYMDRIKINGVSLSRDQEVREGIANAYQQLLLESSDWEADIGRLQLNQINHQEAGMLELSFSKVEVQVALMEMNGDKAPGPDGFTLAF